VQVTDVKICKTW